MTATSPKQPRHSWDHAEKKVSVAQETYDGNERHERRCVQCGITKITVLPPHGLPWVEWRTPDGATHLYPRTAPCSGAPAIVREAAE